MVQAFVNAVVESLREYLLEEIKLCVPYSGFGEAAALSVTPAIYVSLININPVKPIETGERDLNLHLIAFIRATSSRTPLSADADLYPLLSKLLAYIPTQKWQLKYVQEARDVEAINYYGMARGFDKVMHGDHWAWDPTVRALALDLCAVGESTTLWGIAWQQILRLPPTPFEERIGL